MTNIIPANLNTELDTLVSMLEQEMSSDTNNTYSFMPSLVSQSKDIRDSVHLTEDELHFSADTQRKVELGSELDTFCHKVRLGYGFVHYGEEPIAWFKGGNISDFDYYKTFFTNIRSLPADFIQWLKQNSSTDVDVYEAKYQEWAALYEKGLTHENVVKKVMKALDLRSLLFSSLRMYGLTHFEIRKEL